MIVGLPALLGVLMLVRAGWGAASDIAVLSGAAGGSHHTASWTWACGRRSSARGARRGHWPLAAARLCIIDAMTAITQLAPQRRAVASDREPISALMKRSVKELFPRFYDARQTASAEIYVADLDTVLIEDGTYYVHEAGGEIVACGGWSRRNRLHAGAGHAGDDHRLLDPRTEPARVRAMFVRGDWTRRGLGWAILESCERDARAEGFTTLALMATLPGEPLYRAFGFVETGRVMVKAPDGVELAGVTMERPIR